MGKQFNRAFCVFLIILAVLGLGFIWIYDGLHYGSSVTDNVFTEYEADEMYPGAEVSQSFVATGRYMEGIYLFLINLPDEREGEFGVDLLDSNGKVITSYSVSMEEWLTDQWNWINLRHRLSKGNTYTLRAHMDECSGETTPWLLRIENPDMDGMPMCISDNYSGADQCVAVKFSYAIPASNYEKIVLSLFILTCPILAYLILMGEKKANKGVEAAFVGIGLLGLFILYFPNIFHKMKYVNLDDSWRYFLNVAGPKGYIFGKTTVFTYGPLGYLCYLMNLPDNRSYYIAGVIIWVLIICAFAYLLGKIFVSYRKGYVSILSVLMSLMMALAGYSVLERDNFLLYLVLLSFVTYAIDVRNDEKFPIVSAIISNIVLVVMFLGKFSTALSAIAFAVIFSLYEIIICKRVKGIFMSAPSVICMPLAYLIYNPSIKDLGFYIGSIMKLSNEWTESMQFDATVVGKDAIYLALIMVGFVVILITSMQIDYKNAGFILALSASLFSVYKYAITRHGLAVGLWLFGMIYSLIPLVIDYRIIFRKHETQWKILAISGCLILTGIIQTNTIHNDFGNVGEALKLKAHSWTHISESGIADNVYEECMDLPEEYLTEIGDEPVAIYPYKISLAAIYPSLNEVFYPPVVNGEYEPWLDVMVADWFKDGPAKYLILSTETVDEHIQFLENQLTWQCMQKNYTLIGVGEKYCLLKKNDETVPYEKNLKLLKTDTVKVTEEIIVPEGAEYVKIYTDYSFAARIKKFFYHVGTLYLQLNYNDGTDTRGRIIKPNLVTGFELCDYPQDKDDFAAYMIVGPQKEIKSFRFFSEGVKDLKDECIVEWYSED